MKVLHTRICEILGVEHPIISAPMSGTATAELAVAVSEAGGLGLIGAWPAKGPDWLREQIRSVRERTQQPFGVGFISSAPILTKVYDLTWQAPFPKDIGDRVLSNDFTSKWHGRAEQIPAHRQELRELVTGADQAEDASIAQVQVGNATGLISRVEPAGEIVQRIIEEAEAILRSRPQSLLGD